MTAHASAPFGEQVSQLEHALQAAWLAQQTGASPALVTAALLHDVGYLLDDPQQERPGRGITGYFENLGADWLEPRFGPDVAGPVRLHVEAKRYLCAIEPGYRLQLTPASRLTLELQGGQMSLEEAEAFRMSYYGEDAIKLRRWDDAAKTEGAETPDLPHFWPFVEAALHRRPLIDTPAWSSAESVHWPLRCGAAG